MRVIPEKVPSELVSEGQRPLKAKTKLSNNTLGFY